MPINEDEPGFTMDSKTYTRDEIEGMLRRAILFGFNIANEGWNGEYPFNNDGHAIEEDKVFCTRRDRHISAAMKTFGPKPAPTPKGRKINLEE